MRRWLRNILGAVSTLLLTLCLLAWVRSHEAGEVIGREGRDQTGFVARFHGVFSGGGQLALGTLRVHRREGLPEENLFVERAPVRWTWRWRREFPPFPFLPDSGSDLLSSLGFGAVGLDSGTTYRRTLRGLGVPYWALALATAALPAWIILSTTARWIRLQERASAGRCLHCGYDLRGSTGRCPECGL